MNTAQEMEFSIGDSVRVIPVPNADWDERWIGSIGTVTDKSSCQSGTLYTVTLENGRDYGFWTRELERVAAS